MATPSISMPDEMVADVDERRDAPTSRSQYIKEAIRVRQLLEDRDEFSALLENVDATDVDADEATAK